MHDLDSISLVTSGGNFHRHSHQSIKGRKAERVACDEWTLLTYLSTNKICFFRERIKDPENMAKVKLFQPSFCARRLKKDPHGGS